MMEGTHIRLRRTALEHILTRYEWFNDPEFTRLYLGRPNYNFQYKVVEDEIIMAMNSTPATGHFELGIETAADRRYVGNAYLRKINLLDRNAEFGIFIGAQELWGKGLGEEATRLMVQYGFREIGLHRIWLIVFAFNPRAIRCFEKCGFVREGVFRDAIFSAGKYYDVYCMSILEDQA